MSTNPLHIVFMGTPEFAIPVLNVIHNSKFCIVDAVISMPARPAGRGKELTNPPVAQYAMDNSIKCFQSENINRDESFIQFMQQYRPDIVVVLAFAQFLGQKVLSWPKIGCFNIHTSILPRYRGASPIHHALLNGDIITGSCIQKMVRELDAGDVFLEKEITIHPHDNFSSLSQKLSILNQHLITRFIENVFYGEMKNFNIRKQNNDYISTAREIEKQQGNILFKSMTATEIKRKLNAFQFWPGINFRLFNSQIKIHKLNITEVILSPGEIQIVNNILRIGTTTTAIDIIELQPENKKSMTATDYINGKKGVMPKFVEEL